MARRVVINRADLSKGFALWTHTIIHYDDYKETN